MSDFTQGLYVTAMGMGLVFASLGLLMLIIVGLQRLLSLRRGPRPQPLAIAPRPLPEEPIPHEVVAAITVALAVWQERARAQLPPPQTTVIARAPASPAWRASARLY